MVSIVEIVNESTLLLFFVCQLINRKLKSLRVFEALVHLVEFLMISFMLLRRTLRQDEDLMPAFTHVQSMFNTITTFDKPSEIFCICVTILGIIFFGLLIMVRLNLIGLNRKQIVCWACSIMLVTFRLALQSCAMQIYFIFVLSADQYPLLGTGRYVIMVVILLCSLFCLCIHANRMSLSYLHITIPILWILIPNDILVLVVVTLFTLYSQLPGKSDDSYVRLILIICVWTLLEMITPVLYSNELVMLGIILLLSCTQFLMSDNALTLSICKQQQIEEYWPLIERKKESKLVMNAEFKIEQILMQQYAMDDEKQLADLRTIKKDVPHWQRSEHLVLLNTQIQSLYASSKTDSAEILTYKFKLEDQKRNLQTLLVVRNRFDSLSFSKFSFRYQLYTLMARLESWFNKSKNQTLYLSNIIEIDRKVTTFYSYIYIALGAVAGVWRSLTQYPIDYDNIEENHTMIISHRERLQKLYQEINDKCQGSSQLSKMNTLLKLLSVGLPESSERDNPIAKATNVETDSKLSAQIPFLIIKDGIITYVPFRFINQYHYTQDELFQSTIQTIVPTAFQKNFLKLDNESTGIKIQEEKQIILNGEGYIQLVNIESYIIPDFNDSIRYIIFMDNKIATECRGSYILYNVFSDIIEDASKSFMEMFEVDSGIFHSSDQIIRGRDVFESFDFNSEHNQKAMESNDGIIANINMKKLLKDSRSKTNKLKVMLRLLTRFDKLDKPRLVISVSKYRALKDLTASERPRPHILISRPNLLQDDILMKLDAKPVEMTPIEDKYITEIKEAKDALKRDRSRKSLLPLTIIIYVFITAFLIGIVGIYGAAAFRLSWLDFMVNQVSEINSRNMLMSEIMMQSLTLFHLKKYPPAQLTPKQNSAAQANASIILQQATVNFQQVYLDNLQNEKFNQLAFNQQFKNYNLSVNTKQVVLIDFVWEALLAMSNNVQTFMLDNFQIIQTLKDQIKSLNLYQTSYQPYVLAGLVVCCFIALASVLLYSLFVVFMYRIEKTLDCVRKLYHYLPIQSARQRVKEIESMIDQFSEITQNIKSKSAIKKIKDRDNGTNLPQRRGQPCKKAVNQQKQIFFCNFIFQFLGIVIILGIYVFSVLSFLNNETTQTISMIDYGHRLHMQQLEIKNSLLESYYKLIRLKYQKLNYQTDYNTTLVNTVVEIGVLFPRQFSSFISSSWQYLNRNLCLLATNDTERLQCQSLYSGILKQGFSKAARYYQNCLNQLELLTLDTAYSGSLFSNTVFMQRFLLKQASFISSQYVQAQLGYCTNLMNTHTLYLIGGLVLLAFITFRLHCNWKQHQTRIQICKVMFINSPCEMLCNGDSRKHIEQTKLIEKLMKL